MKKKYVIVVADGMADYPVEELGGRTPLEAARTPAMDSMAANGMVGRASFIPAGMAPGSDVANMAIFGYDPRRYYAGRGPLEAENLGIELRADEIAFRCNLITEENGNLVDYSAGHISTREAKVLVDFLNATCADETVRFYPGVSYRHIAVVRGNCEELLNLQCVPPHDIIGKRISEHLPRAKGKKEENYAASLMEKTRALLAGHEINSVRVDLKENPANMIWLWGQGKKAVLPSFAEKFGRQGSVISAVDLIKGIGRAIGLTPLDVPGITGYYDTNYEAKAEYALESLKKNDFVFIHVEAPDEAGHNGDTRAKITAIENIDRHIVAKICAAYSRDDIRVLALPDHPTPVSLRTHTADPVGFVLYGFGIEQNGFSAYSERTAAASPVFYKNGFELIDYFFNNY
ncbi:MAG: cofactor-independent phosphoglycerate mutase [Candidatus Omnitrophica bacterium]|nr:cofactor-independent phosphoglycerate mutase [Candidatus Omnitrophota bacterium]